MKKTHILTGILLCSAIILVGAQTGFAWSTYEEGCINCHGTGFAGFNHTLHANAGVLCASCHGAVPGSKPVASSNCIVCHPPADSGVCPRLRDA